MRTPSSATSGSLTTNLNNASINCSSSNFSGVEFSGLNLSFDSSRSHTNLNEKGRKEHLQNVKNHRNNNNNHKPTFISFNDGDGNGAGLNFQNEIKRVLEVKSRVPDILMINKYYGLIPQKFTISSRKPSATSSSSSAPSSANSSSRRTSKSTTSKPRAKSSTYHQPNSNSNGGSDVKGYRSEDETVDDPVKMVLNARLWRSSSIDSDGVATGTEGSDPFGPVSKKMSVEKYKKWKASGGLRRGGRGTVSTSFSQSELFSDTSSSRCHARRRSSGEEEDDDSRRVIKIDLNNVSWDEEEHYNPGTTESSMNRSFLRDVKKTNINVQRKGSASRERGDENNGNRTTPIQLSSFPVSFLDNNSNSSGNGRSETKDRTIGTGSENMRNFETIEVKEKSPTLSSSDNENCVLDSSSHKEAKPQEQERPGKLSSRAISFDDKIINGEEARAVGSIKKRPTTATSSSSSHSARSISSSSPLSSGKTFSTPNSFNPPSKVIPWTQQKSAGGKPLTLAERRAKLQRAPSISIHSSSSVSISMELSEEDGGLLSEDVESVSTTTTTTATATTSRVPSAAFRELRKPLHVTQPPEIPTMMSQIIPNADEDIQIEIEKVAIMLRKTQSLQNFSRSLDSGIEVDSGKGNTPSPLSSREGMKIAQSTGNLAKCDDESSLKEKGLELECGGSESSISSSTSRSSGEEEDEEKVKNKDRGGPPGIARNSTTVSPARLHENEGRRSDRHDKRQCVNVSTASTGKKVAPLNSNSSSSNPVPSLRRPPLKKAVSISCEHELSKTAAGNCGSRGNQRGNEVNSRHANDSGKGGRPKTAAAATTTTAQRQRISSGGTGTRSTHSHNYTSNNSNNNQSQSGNRQGLMSQSHQESGIGNNDNVNDKSPNGIGSQGLRNRKILIKKALMEINQSRESFKRKWGILGRPRTAPNNSSEKITKNLTNGSSMSQAQSQIPGQRRRPMKASPIPISGNGKIGSSSSSRLSLLKGSSSVEAGEKMDRTSETEPTTEETVRSTDQPKEDENDGDSSSGPKRSPFRQSFSLDEGQLLGFSRKSVKEEGRIPLFERMISEENNREVSAGGGIAGYGSLTSILNDEISFLSSKKREQCLKVYEKMKKTGCSIKLDTIFRGMLTPSEYRAFMRAAEKAAQEEEEAKEENVDVDLEQFTKEEVEVN